MTILPRPRWRGFYFALLQPHTSVCSAFCIVNATIPPTQQNSAQGFTGAFPEICPILPLQIPDRQKRLQYHLCNAGGHTRVWTPSAYTRYQTPRRTLYRPAQPPIIIRYIRAQRRAPVMDPCQTVQHIADRASPAAVSIFSTPGGLRSGTGSAIRAHRLAPSTRRGSPAAVARRAARNNRRLSPHLFSGFRQIANRGQQ